MKLIFKNAYPSSFQPKKLGFAGEEIAAKFLEEKGYQVLYKNYVIRGGEIDLIGLKEQTLIFFEIKTRKNFQFGFSSETISPRQKTTLLRTAQHFLTSNILAYAYKNVQFDLLVLHLTTQNSEKLIKIAHYRNIFLE